ncbi:uncharacterized protein PHACADRAFT_211536 [Phanerochaete carnosa HHB-10118-sp]|uniref:Uncharacterized protein n=1 Tax=Phanerochaete carnosa (strain HHB-10118-sp) TaxID=650164 RepID=K5W059_PHACS|nr:uncharacterized protein PHACADRAFT_211536 [Phanerochaete carnosa HHB-10118-sp]EKM52264.1 hypothetical protein PHACADRAFT_211536 [Phanerochaete carnosa HHB-10118-sp]
MKSTHKVYPAVATYQECLNLLGHGRPLWQHPENEMSIGDVGDMSCIGIFRPLFNFTLPRDHPVNRYYGVPANFEVLELGLSDIQRSESHLEQGAILASPGVDETKPGLGAENIVTIGARRPDRSFACTKDAGAVLLLPEGAARVELTDRAQHRIHDYCVKHIGSWAAYLREGRERLMPELVQHLLVVTGVVKSSTWAKGVYAKNPPPDPEREHLWTLLPTCLQRTRLGPIVAERAVPCGPGTYGPFPRDSCVFILESRFKIRRSLRDVCISRIKGPGSPRNVDFLMTGGWESNCHDAVQEILNYILKYSSAKIAVAGTRDLRALVPCMPTPPSPDSFVKYLKKLRPKIIVNDAKVGSLDIESLSDPAEK